jgi:hypothetical protein
MVKLLEDKKEKNKKNRAEEDGSWPRHSSLQPR